MSEATKPPPNERENEPKKIVLTDIQKIIVTALVTAFLTLVVGAFGVVGWKGGMDQWRSSTDERLGAIDAVLNPPGGRTSGISSTAGSTAISGDLQAPGNTWGSSNAPCTGSTAGCVAGIGGGESGRAACPDGQYVAGIIARDGDTGDKCGGCLTGVEIVCHPL